MTIAMKRRFWAAAMAFCAAAVVPRGVWAIRIEKMYGVLSGGRPLEVVAEEAMVRFSSTTPAAQRAAALGAVGARLLGELPSVGWTQVGLPAGMPVAAGMEILKRASGVLEVAPNHVYRALKTPNDPLVGSQYHLAQVDAFGGWEFETGTSSRVTIAVIDAGIEGTHSDLSPKLVSGRSEFCSPTTGVCSANSPPTAACDHATRVAGVAAAATNNGSKVAGMSWGAQLVSIKIFNDSDCNVDCSNKSAQGCGTDDPGIVGAINYASSLQGASDVGRVVVNMSIGGAGACSAVVQAAVTSAINNNVSIVAAAGNDGSDVNAPGNCAGVIPVGATDSSGNVTSFSSRGGALATGGVVAPGFNLVTTDVNNGTTSSASGTSFSSPLVAGLGSLIIAADPTRTPAQIQSILRNSAESIGQAATVQGAGRVNAFLALRLTTRGTLSDFAGEQKPIAFPNPFHPSVSGNVTITIPPGLAGANPQVKIYTMDGRLVRDLAAQTSWDGKNTAGHPVATGSYIFFLKTDHGQATGKFALIR